MASHRRVIPSLAASCPVITSSSFRIQGNCSRTSRLKHGFARTPRITTRWSDTTLQKTSCVCWTSDQMGRGASLCMCVNWMVTLPNSIGMEIAKMTLTSSPVWCVGWCLSRTNLMHILVRNQVYHHTPTRTICHYTNRDDLWKNCEPLCTRSERLFDTPLRRKLRTLTSLILSWWSVFVWMYIVVYFCSSVSCDLRIIWSKTSAFTRTYRAGSSQQKQLQMPRGCCPR